MTPLSHESLPTRRSTCERCLRPTVTCYCAHVVPQRTQTQVLVLQHPREQRTAIGTAHMAHLGLDGSILRVGLDFSDDHIVNDTIAARPDCYVLFPGPDTVPASAIPRDRPITLVVLDGTWWQAKKLLTLNPQLAALPRVGFQPQRPSDYRIRRQPADFCVSTIEALAEVLALLEDDPARFSSLLAPFRAMVDAQIRYAEDVHSKRHARRVHRPRVRKRAPLGERLAALGERMVCVYGDANGWPMRHPEWKPAELVHWIATRPHGGETMELVLAPRKELGPNTTQHIELSRATLEAGVSEAEAAQRWAEFLRPDDVLVHYGPFHRNLAELVGMKLDLTRIDLRSELLQAGHTQLGGLESCAKILGVELPAPAFPGRAGRRLSTLISVIQKITAQAPSEYP